MIESNPLLVGMLEIAVPMWVDQVSQLPFNELGTRSTECSQFITEHGDDLLYRGKHTQEAFNHLAEGIAILSLFPGGVNFMGMHFENERKEG